MYSITLTILVTAGIMIKPIPVQAEQASADRDGGVMEEVIVTASPYVRRRIVSTDSSGVLTETLSLKRYVSYSDLDLSKYNHVTELKSRIEVNAKEACEQLADLYPTETQGGADMQGCVKLAIESANEGLVAAIAAAN